MRQCTKPQAIPAKAAGSWGRSSPTGKARESTMKLSLRLAAGAAVLVSASAVAFAADWYPYKIESWESFDMASPRHSLDYSPLEKAASKHKLCVSFPHMKDDYWLAVDYGVIAEAKRIGVSMQVLEAGGYT